MAARGLGKGLDSLIPMSVAEDKIIEDVAKKEGNTEEVVDINYVTPNRDQPRKSFDKEKLEELAESIKIHGIVEPILVQDRKDHYEIVAGERRWRAAKLAGLMSEGMLLCAEDAEGNLALMVPEKQMPSGAEIS